MFYRRTTHVAELQMGIPANRLEDACAIDHFDTSRLPFITLLCEFLYLKELLSGFDCRHGHFDQLLSKGDQKC